MIEELQELVENLEDVIHKLVQEQSDSKTEVNDMKQKMASRASEQGLAYYLDKVASYLQRELGMRPRQTLDKV